MLTVADKDRDWAAILEGARAFARTVPFRDLLPRIDGRIFAEAVRRTVGLDACRVLLMVDEAGRLQGGLGYLLLPYLWNPALLYAEEIFWWAAPDAPATAGARLILAYRSAARREGAKIWAASALSSSPAGVRKVYESLGMVAAQVSFIGRL